MKFSDVFNVSVPPESDWFDPVLSLDTPLFIDPFLVYAQEFGPFNESHKDINSFFNAQFKLIAAAPDASSLKWRKAESNLCFPEVEELCLGYSSASTKGAGSGKGFAKLMASAIKDAIKAGLKKIEHFEELALLEEGIGADRISDITGNLLRYRLATYTRETCERLGVPCETFRFLRGRYAFDSSRWEMFFEKLPRNPYTRRPILLCPRIFLRDLPTIDPSEFWEFCYTNDNETLRDEFNLDVASRVSKSTIVRMARKHPNLRREYICQKEKSAPEPYDFRRDSKGVDFWYHASKAFAQKHPLNGPSMDSSGLLKFVLSGVEQFQQYIEQNGGWQLLWNDDGTQRAEAAAQRLLLGILKHYCASNDIDISKEVDIGRGPVDFKFSRGTKARVLLELKKANNTRFWDGLTGQLPTYLTAEGIQEGVFLVIAYSDQDLKRCKGIQQILSDLNKKLPYQLTSKTISAIRPVSASKTAEPPRPRA